MTITYTVAIDWNDDGDFTDIGEDITADVLALHWRLGMDAPHQSRAAPIHAAITLRSPDGDYAPEVTANALVPGKRLRIQTHDGTTLRTHFTGFIARVEPEPGDQGTRRSIIHARGADAELDTARIRLPPQVSVRADTVIAAILDRVPLRRTILKDVWIVMDPAHSTLGTSTRLAGETITRQLETGKSTFAYVGDTWGNGIAASAALAEAAEGERGRFFIDRAGDAVFYNRHHTLLATTSAAAFEDSADLSYDYGADTVNQVSVRLTPRRLAAAAAALWTLENTQRVMPGEGGTRQLIVQYRDSTGQPVGALSVISPQRYTDFTANTRQDGTGIDVTGSVELVVVQADSSAALIEFRNSTEAVAYILSGAQLRGTAIAHGDPVTVTQTDYASVSLYGLSALQMDIPAIDSVEDADQLARYEVARRKAPRGTVSRLTLDARRHPAHALGLTLFDRITIRDSQVGHDGDYFIIAEEHTVDLSGTRHRVAWTLEPAASSAFWKLNTAALNLTTTLTY